LGNFNFFDILNGLPDDGEFCIGGACINITVTADNSTNSTGNYQKLSRQKYIFSRQNLGTGIFDDFINDDELDIFDILGYNGPLPVIPFDFFVAIHNLLVCFFINCFYFYLFLTGYNAGKFRYVGDLFDVLICFDMF